MKFERYYSAKEDFGLRLEYCGIEHCKPDFVMPPHSRDVFLIHYVFDGEGELECQGVRHVFSASNLFIIFPHDIISYRARGEKLLKFCWVGFSGENAARLVNRIGLTQNEPVCHLIGAESIISLVSECTKKCGSELPYTDVLMQSVLYRLFGEIERCLGKRRMEKKTGNAAFEHVSRAKSYIGFNYMRSLSISQIALYVNLERTYFSRIFHQIEGITPQEYLLHYRIGVAQRLLLESRYSIKEIGTLVGITDPYYFSKAFKKITGLSPSQYHQKNT